MDGPRYILAVIAVISLGTAAGAFVHHREGSSYAIPMALAIVGMPTDKLPVEVIREILPRGASVCRAAGMPIAGGHSIDSPEPIYGLVALGIVHPAHVKRNDRAQAGCRGRGASGLQGRQPVDPGARRHARKPDDDGVGAGAHPQPAP